MGIMQWLGIGDEVAKPIEAVGKLYTTDKERLQAQKDLELALNQPKLAQLENNKLLILTGKLFNSGWQPLIGWTSGACVFMYWVPQLFVANYVWATHCLASGTVTQFPIAPDDIYNLVWLLFGFGGYSLIKKKLNV